MSQQQALLLEAKFAEMAIRTIDIPTPGPGELLVRIESAALNPMDWKVQKWGIFVDKVPTVLGWDIAGLVVHAGDRRDPEFSVSDRVFFQGTRTDETRAFQQYTVVNSELVGKIPDEMSYDDAATLPVAAFTAFVALYQKSPEGLGLPNYFVAQESGSSDERVAGHTIVILGGSSQVGQYALQYAKLTGFSTIITTASTKHTDHLKSLGATHVIDRNASLESFTSQLSEITGSNTVKYVIDTISSPETQQFGYDLLTTDGGELVLVLPGDEIKNKVEGKKINVFSAFNTFPQHRELATLFFKGIAPYFVDGTLKTTAVEVLPNGLAGIKDGLKRLEDNKVSGLKLIARPQET